MKLQVSFDSMDLDQAIKVASKVEDYADILEIGTLLIYKYGIVALEKFRKRFPDKELLADLKIIDKGTESVNLAAQANWISVMSGTSKKAILNASKAAQKNSQKIVLDLIDSPAVGQSALEAESLGVDALLLHGSFDAEDPLEFLENWDMIQGNTKLPIFVSSIITKENIDTIINLHPHGLVIGKAITEAEDPKAEAKMFHELINNGDI
jgi:3-hexulose-6-phosphate synthase